MEKNVGSGDRIARAVIGLIMLIIGIYSYTADMNLIITAITLLVGIILLGTGVSGYCVLYSAADVNICSSK